MTATESDIEAMARVLRAADDTRRGEPAKPDWRDYRGMATAVLAYLAVQKAHAAT